MIHAIAILFFLFVALVFSILACSSRTTERLLWGTVLCSLGLGLAAQLSDGGYYGLVMVAAFLVTDLVVYLYLRTLGMAPNRGPKNHRLDKLIRSFFLWLALCAVVGGGIFLFQPQMSLPGPAVGGSGIALLHERIWAGDWLLVMVPVAMLVSFVVGGFFLVRRAR